MNSKPLLGLAAVAFCTHAAAQITFYESDHFRGRTFATSQPVSNFKQAGFNDQASSVVVERGRWEVCDDSRYRGRCVVLRRGSYDSLRNMGLENRISSVRPAPRDRQYENEPQPVLDTPYEYRRRPNERLSRGAGDLGARRRRPARAALLDRAPAGRRSRSANYNVPGRGDRRRPRRHPRPPDRRRHRQGHRHRRRRGRRRGDRRPRQQQVARRNTARATCAAAKPPRRAARRSTTT